jgi:hypothetical protein
MPDRAENDFAIVRAVARVVPLRAVNERLRLGPAASSDGASRGGSSLPDRAKADCRRERPNKMLTRASGSLRCVRRNLIGTSTSSRCVSEPHP